MRCANGELEPASLEADDHRRARELLGRAAAIRCNRRNNDLTGQATEGDLARVIKEPGPFFVSARPRGNVGEKNFPPAAEDLFQPIEVGEIVTDFLDGDQIELANDFRDVIKRFVIAAAIFCSAKFA